MTWAEQLRGHEANYRASASGDWDSFDMVRDELHEATLDRDWEPPSRAVCVCGSSLDIDSRGLLEPCVYCLDDPPRTRR